MSVAALVLAAGGSARLGQPKQLLRYRGQSLVRNAVAAALQAGCRPVAVVVGRDHLQIAADLHDLSVSLVPNDCWKRGIGTSIRVGVEALKDETALVLIVCDQPHVKVEVIRGLVSRHEETQKPIVASAYAGTLGVPALFAAGFFSELMKLPDDHGAKRIIASHPEAVASINFPEGAIDIDRSGDLPELA